MDGAEQRTRAFSVQAIQTDRDFKKLLRLNNGVDIAAAIVANITRWSFSGG